MKYKNRFILYTFLASWLLWLPTVIHTQLSQVPNFLLLLGMFAGFMPSLFGLYFIKKEEGQGFKLYLKKRLSLNFSKRWLLALLIFPLHSGITLALTQVLDQGFKADIIPLLMTPLVFLQILFVGGAIGEEFGWRGFLYEKLLKKYGLLFSTLLIGLIWSIWHLPLFFMTGTVQSYLPIWQFVLQNTLLAFFYTWLFHKTKGNILMMILLHAVMNTSAAVFPYWQSSLGRYLGLFGMVLILLLIKLWDKKSFTEKTSY